MKRIFISYRRHDSKYQARMIYASFEQAVTRDNVFMDVDSIPPGANFRKILKGWVDECDVLLALIGPGWIDASDPASGARRLDNPSDFVRIEIGEALARDIPVVPVLLDGAPLPHPDQLPPDLKELCDRQAEFVEYRTFDADVARLIKKLGLGASSSPSPRERGEGRGGGASEARAAAEGEGRPRATMSATSAPHPVSAPHPDPLPVRTGRGDDAARFEAEGRIKIDAAIFFGDSEAAKAGWLKPGAGRTEWFKDIDICPEMLVVPAGSFTMGSPANEPERSAEREAQLAVTIARPFAVGRCTVTRGEFAAFVKATGYAMPGPAAYGWTASEWKQDAKYSWRNPGFPQDDRHPVGCVNWDDALAYVTWLSEVTRKPYRLLSEAEWEYAARADTTSPFWWGPSISTAQANYNGNHTYAGGAKGVWRKGTLPVDYAQEQFGPNPWGLHQVHGNVWEWCADCWNDNNESNPGDGSARTTGDCSFRVARGGSWSNEPQNLRAANRNGNSPGNRSNDVGFRVGRSLLPPRML